MSMCVLTEVFTERETPAGFGEIRGKAIRKRRAWRQKCKGLVPPEKKVGSRGGEPHTLNGDGEV